MPQGGGGLSEEVVIRQGKWAGLEQEGLTTGHFSNSDSEGHWQLMCAHHHKHLMRSSQPACGACESGMQGSGFGGGQVLLGREGPEKEVGVVRTCLTRDFSDFVGAHPAPLKMPRGDRELTISWQDT